LPSTLILAGLHNPNDTETSASPQIDPAVPGVCDAGLRITEILQTETHAVRISSVGRVEVSEREKNDVVCGKNFIIRINRPFEKDKQNKQYEKEELQPSHSSDVGGSLKHHASPLIWPQMKKKERVTV
jgi:hypothetical protein